MIKCEACDHESADVIEAWQHREEHPELPPAPIFKKGMLTSVVINGKVFTDYVTHVGFDPKTGSETVVMGEDPLARTEAILKDMLKALTSILRPRWVPLWLWRFWLKMRGRPM